MNGEVRALADNRVAGALMCVGSTIVLSVTDFVGWFPFSLLIWISFGLVFLFGVYVARKRPEGRILAMATLWFATVGGLPFLWIFGLPNRPEGVSVLVGYLGILGIALTVAGAALKLTEPLRGPAQRPRLRLFQRAAGFLGVGSFALLLAAGVSYPGLSIPVYAALVWRTILVVLGLWLHLIAWIELFAATSIDFAEESVASRVNRGRLAWTISVLAFVAAVYLAPLYVLYFSQDPYRSLFLVFTLAPPFPYHPAIFAPVVLCHAFIFRGYSRFLPAGASMKIVQMGVLALAAAVAVGIFGLVAFVVRVDLPSPTYWWVFLPFPSGSTAIGYGLVFFGWRVGERFAGGTDDQSTPAISPIPGRKPI